MAVAEGGVVMRIVPNCFIAFCVIFAMPWFLGAMSTIERELPKQTLALQQIAANTTQPIKTDVVSVDPRVVALCSDAVKPKGRK